jgi:hypothetical protein
MVNLSWGKVQNNSRWSRIVSNIFADSSSQLNAWTDRKKAKMEACKKLPVINRTDKNIKITHHVRVHDGCWHVRHSRRSQRQRGSGALIQSNNVGSRAMCAWSPATSSPSDVCLVSIKRNQWSNLENSDEGRNFFKVGRTLNDANTKIVLKQ